MSHEGLEPQEFFEERDRLDKAIMIAIVATLLIAALVAFFQIRALKRHDSAISQADQWVAAASQASFRFDSVAQLQLDRFYVAQEARVRAEQAQADALLGVGPGFNSSVADSERWNGVYKRLWNESAALVGGNASPRLGISGEFGDIQQLTQGSVPGIAQSGPVSARKACPQARATWRIDAVPGRIPLSGAESPTSDPSFPLRYLADSRRDVYYLQARGTLASEHAEAEEKQFIRFGISLTLFASAVFLFGFALSPYGRLHRPLYVTGASLFVIGSMAMAIRAAIDTPVTGNPMAAAAYADAQVAATRGTDRSDTAAAIAFNGCAIKFDSSFAPAYTGQAIALNNMFDPTDPTGGSNTELVDNKHLVMALADLENAEDHGASDPIQPMLNGTDVFQTGLGIKALNTEKLEQGLQQEQQAAQVLSGSQTENQLVSGARDPAGDGADGGKAQAAKLLATSTLIAFNIAEAQLALGQFRGAQRSYKTAVELANQQLRSAGAAPPINPSRPQVFASGALTDLLDLANHTTAPSERAIHDHARQEKDYVVSHLFNESGPTSPVKVVHTVVLPGLVGFGLDRPPSFARRHAINAQWYYQSPNTGAWSAFTSALSGPQAPPSQTDLFTTPFVPTSVCLGSGKYMLEVYVNGQLAGQTKPFSERLPNLAPATLQDMGVSICRPASGRNQWQPVPDGLPHPGRPTRFAGLIDGYMSRDRRAGLLVFDVTAEADRERNGNGTSALLRKAVGQLHDWLPGPLSDEGGVLFPFLGGSLGSQTRLYAYPRGVLVAGIGATGTGRVIVGAVYGPSSMFLRGKLPLAVGLLGSVVSRE